MCVLRLLMLVFDQVAIILLFSCKIMYLVINQSYEMLRINISYLIIRRVKKFLSLFSVDCNEKALYHTIRMFCEEQMAQQPLIVALAAAPMAGCDKQQKYVHRFQYQLYE
jgi:hypothetical protein